MIRHAIYLPLAFLAGQHGFALLAPYLTLCVAAQTVIVHRRQRKAIISDSIESAVMLNALPA